MQWTTLDGWVARLERYHAFYVLRVTDHTGGYWWLDGRGIRRDWNYLYATAAEAEGIARRYLGPPDSEADSPEMLAYDIVDQID